MSTTGRAERTRLAVVMVMMATALVTLTGSVSHTAAAADTWCPTGAVKWDGGANTDKWYDDLNWNTNVAPGDADSPLKRVCLPSSTNVLLEFGDFDGLTDISTLDMAPGSVLTIDDDGRLLLEGAQGSVTSHVMRSKTGTPATLVVEGVLGGQGHLVVDGVLRLKRTADGPPTITSRYCELEIAGCTPDIGAPNPGRTTIGKKGLLRVTGIPSAGPNLQGSSLADRHAIDVMGELRVESPAYLAVDDGTSIIVRKNTEARIVLEGGASIYQGRVAHGDPVAVLDLRGTIAKSKEGTGLLDMNVKVAASARSEVLRGRLSVGANRAPRAKVRDGATYGIGRCDGAESNCAFPKATSADRLLVAVSLPAVAGNKTADVQITEKAKAAQDLVPPVEITVTKFVATAKKPMTFTFTLDDLSVGARTPASLEVTRDGQSVVNCKPDGTPKSGRACVKSRTLLGDGDVVLVVNTQVSSRWKVR